MTRTSRCRVSLLAILLVVLTTIPTQAWNATAHRLIALIAFQRLSAEQQTKLVSLLKKHPRFENDFRRKMPGKVKNGSEREQNQWTFMQAAIWPDIVRGFRGRDKKKYHHGSWHYINVPIYLTRNDATEFNGRVPVNLSRTWRSGMRSNRMNIIQALHKTQNRLKASTVRDSEKAVYLCWLLHLVGDLHQPLHSSALFSQRRFPRGDKGGNSIPLVGKKSLHNIWDGGLGRASSLSVLLREVRRVNRDSRLRSRGENSIKPASMKFEVWLKESHKLAKSVVYDKSIIETLVKVERTPSRRLRPFHLGTDYFRKLKSVSAQRVVQAGYRLAEFVRKSNVVP